MIEGRIIKGIGGFYYVDTDNGLYECRARGIFRKNKITPLVGDFVKISVVDEENKKGVVEEIAERETELVRPPIANVNKALIVFAVKNPTPHLSLLDRFIVLAERENLEIVIILTKIDLDDDNTFEKIKNIYEPCGYKVIGVSNLENKNIDKVKEELKDNTVVFAGPSGVGKTETGRLLAKLLGEEMFYSQFSMFQNEGHLNYLYGNKIQEPSFAKDLLKRTSNIIFLDEFDKANRFVYSALYQMFDTGEFEDNNFHVNLKNTLVICTSNYENPQKIYEHLGEPMFFRINCFIRYQQLSKDVKEKLIDKYYNSLIEQLDTEEKQIINNSKIKDKYKKIANELDNARQIENFIRNEIAKELVRNLK